MAKDKYEVYENKYESLYEYLLRETRDDFILTYEEIEEIIGFGLPRAAQRAEWWDDDTPEYPRDQAQAIHQAGYDSRRAPEGGKVRFRKLSTLPRTSR
ncbi:DUF7662 domain-containing protein [Rhodoplanes sp. Z2-YC6860]|uniref:DUF7662 domain-containing protein n=1 Tax=Rhodoplanes sp. Z2-YC6860 TaxID=674703 RepID=UPI00078CE3FD|nr:hypothetical protein [Rhodoplanes sp. Z2-YC6860]AMN38610.1 hypothetical protein RHPLAN_01450 [Rhodoplanes sp. Z2-YC6860]